MMTPKSRFFTEVEKRYSFPKVGGHYQINSRYCPKGEVGGVEELGDLEELDFSSQDVVGVIQVWSGSWLGAHFWSLKEEKELLNILLRPQESKDGLFKKLDRILENTEA